MKGRESNSKGAPPAADLLVCFPSRAHLALMPKPICSPARLSDSSKRRSSKSRFHQHQHLKKSSTRNGGHGSPLLWGKNKSMDDEITEPTSPKVTCAGQIKVRPKNTSCRSWQSVMEEIEKIHKDRNQRKRSSWVDSLGFKKEVVQFLTCLRSIRFDLRCFGSFPESDITTDDEDDEEELEGYQENHAGGEETECESSKTVFSKWFMVLQEEQNSNRFCMEDKKQKGKLFDEGSNGEPTVPPSNALLLMRCMSAPAKSWVEKEEHRQDESDEKEKNGNKEQQIQKGRSLRSLMEEENKNNDNENLVVMRYESDVCKISCDIAKETWLVGGLKDSLSRSRSWKR